MGFFRRGILLLILCAANFTGLWAQKAVSARQVRNAMGLAQLLPEAVMDQPQLMLSRIEFLHDSLKTDSSSEIWGQLAWFRAEALYRQTAYKMAATELGDLLNHLNRQGAENTLLLRMTMVLHGLALEFYSLDTESAHLLLRAYSLATHVQDKRMMFDIGIIFARWSEELENLESAEIWLKKSEELAAELQDARCYNRLYNRKSSIFRQLMQPDSALFYAEKALEWGKKAGPDNELATTYLILGLINYPNGISPAKEYFELGAAENKKGGDHSFVWNIAGLARLHIHHHDYPAAKRYLDSIQVILPSINFPMFVPEVSNTLQSYYNAIGEKDSALKYMESYYEARLEVEGGKREVEVDIARREFMRQRQLMQIQSQNLEIKETETERQTLVVLVLALAIIITIILFLAIRLRIRNRSIHLQHLLIQTINQNLEKSIQEKEVLLKEVNHRVKNNLQMIGTFLDLQEASSSHEELKPVLEDVRHRIKAMGLVHELILEEGDLEELEFCIYANALLAQLTKMAGPKQRIECEIDCMNIRFDLATTMYLGIMVNELCLNALQHAQVEGSPLELEIKLRRIGQEYVLTFKDNGPGLPLNVDFIEARSIGLYLIKAMGQQLDGTVAYSFEGGACFTLRF